MNKEPKKNVQKQGQGVRPDEPIPVQPQKKKFHGFSMGFLLILLAVVVGLYIVCTFMAR